MELPTSTCSSETILLLLYFKNARKNICDTLQLDFFKFSRNILKFMFNSNEFKAAKDASSISYMYMHAYKVIDLYLPNPFCNL